MAGSLLLLRPPGPVPVDVGATIADTEPVTRVDLDGLADAYWRSYADSSLAFPLDDAREDIARYFDGGYGPPVEEASLLVRRDDALIAAVLTVREAPYPDAPPGPFVIDLFVVPTARRHGVGRAVTVAALRAVGAETVGLRVEADNVAARRLYEALGFEIA